MWDNIFFEERNGKILANVSTNGCGCCSEFNFQEDDGTWLMENHAPLTAANIEDVCRYLENRLENLRKYGARWCAQEGVTE